MIPCAEMVRFGKNGSDATSGAVRLARAYTGRDRIAVCGYHGWQDWYIGSTARNRGVPSAVSALTHVFQYNSLESLSDVLRKHPGEFAAVILEPMNVVDPVAGFLEGVKSLAHQHGALLVFDETITGFRFANGGAQAYFNVTPDLATFGKGLANGYPLSAVVGRKDIMILMEEIFFSFTFGGELLSLAASNACLDKYAQKDVVKTMFEIGTLLKKGVVDLIGKHDLSDVLSISGHPAWTFLNFKDHPTATLMELKTFFLQEVFCRGILTAGTHNISFAHNQAKIFGKPTRKPHRRLQYGCVLFQDLFRSEESTHRKARRREHSFYALCSRPDDPSKLLMIRTSVILEKDLERRSFLGRSFK